MYSAGKCASYHPVGPHRALFWFSLYNWPPIISCAFAFFSQLDYKVLDDNVFYTEVMQ